MKKYKLFWIIFFSIVLSSCLDRPEKDISEQEAAISWAEMTLFITKNTPANSPTYASRAVGYIGLTMYESIVKGYPDYRSLEGQLNGQIDLPNPEPDKRYNWTLSMNAGQAFILKNIYRQTSDDNKTKIDSLAKVIHHHFAKDEEKHVVERSVEFGQNIAKAIHDWSMSDGGYRSYLENFDKTFQGPERQGSWQPPYYAQSISHHPLHPNWGKNRTFLKENGELPFPEMIPYDTSKNSRYYKEFVNVYEKERSLTQEEKEIAIWWGDDPSETFTPPGHSYYLATIALKKEGPPMIKCAETFARVGIAVADAFINCWKWKYYFFTERPNTFIPRVIDQEWQSFWPDPPFPSFPSGHAIQAAAATTVLTDLFGEEFHFVDSAHVGRPRDEIRDVDFKPRTFSSFWEVAEETAFSRFCGGIHTLHDNKVGLENGKVIAQNVNNLTWKHEN